MLIPKSQNASTSVVDTNGTFVIKLQVTIITTDEETLLKRSHIKSLATSTKLIQKRLISNRFNRHKASVVVHKVQQTLPVIRSL